MSILADVSAFSNPFGAPSKGQWNLSEGVFTINGKSIKFFYNKDPSPTQRTGLEQITDTGSRRLAIYKYPYRDGQRVADLGRDGETFTFNIKFYGNNYQQLLYNFLGIVNQSGIGTLTHPVRSGQKGIPARFKDWEFVHQYGEWNAVTIKAVFIEDNTDALASANVPAVSQDSALRSVLQSLVSSQAFIQQTLFSAGALLLLPASIISAMQLRSASISDQLSSLLGKLTATFSSDAQLKSLAAQASTSGGVAILTSGITSEAELPPVYQVGFDSATQVAVGAQLANFTSGNQITPQQAVFAANQVRMAISAAIAEVDLNLGNDGYAINIQYRSLAVEVQQAVEASIATAQSLVTVYTVPYAMSLRTVAYLNGLTPDDQNALEALNPYLASVNYIARGTVLTVPAA